MPKTNQKTPKTAQKAFSYAALVQDLPAVAFQRLKSPDGKISYPFVSEKGRSLLGLSPNEKILTDIDGCLDVVHWSDKDAFAEEITRSEKDKNVSREKFRAVLPSGETKWFYGYAKPSFKKDGSVLWNGIWVDVSADKRKDQLQTLVLKHIKEGIIAFDRQGAILICTPAAADLLNCPPEKLENGNVFSLFPDTGTAETLKQFLLNPYNGTNGKAVFITTMHGEGCNDVILEISLSKADDFFIAQFRDITERRQKEMQLQYLAFHDAETGVSNYAYLKENFPRILEQAKTSKTQVAILSIAPDSLGQINAVAGHVVGTHLLSEMAKRIQNCLTNQDILLRTSGHHFVVLLCGLEFNLEAEAKIESILHAFDETMDVDGLDFDVSVCVGVCFCPQDGEDIDNLISHADLALEKARSEAKGSMRIYTGELSMPAVANMSMHKKLKQALENNEIFPYFQPQVDIATGRIIGLEALARWKSCDGMIPPADFIPEAEEYGLIDTLAEIILNQACSWNQKWYAMGLSSIPVAVNISGRQFHNENQLLKMVDRVLENTGLPPYLLELELTESSAMYDPKNARRIIQTLLDNNIRCALDDFGTGYSSLSVLRSFPLKKLKIDRSFVLQLSDLKNLEIVRATIAMAHALKLSVLAEGVENKQHFEILRDLGCDIIQGYLFSRPLPAEETEILLSRWDARMASTGKGL